MRQTFRTKVLAVASYLENVLAAVVLIAVALMSIQLVSDIIPIARSAFDTSRAFPFETFIEDALKLVIGIEFVKMLVRYTAESVVEILLFAMARKLIAGSSTSLDIVVGISAVAVLFVIRRFILCVQTSDESSQAEDTFL